MTNTTEALAPTEQKPLPCPFCGSPAEPYPDGDMEGYSLMCTGDGALFGGGKSCCPMTTFGYATHDEAVAAWNQRASIAPSARSVLVMESGTASHYRKCKSYQTRDVRDTYIELLEAALLATPAAPSVSDGWRQYAKDGESAQQCIERHRGEQDALMKLLAQSKKQDRAAVNPTGVDTND
jgi:hypothetical protein